MIVLLFHEVHSRTWFQDVVKFISKRYKLIDSDELFQHIENRNFDKRLCHITFDDGHKTFYENVYPVLQDFNVPVTLFVSPNVILNETNYWFQVMEYANQDELYKRLSKFYDLNREDLKQYHALSLLKNLTYEEIDFIFKEDGLLDTQIGNLNIDEQQMIEMSSSGLVTIGGHSMHHPILNNESNENSYKEITDSITVLSDILKKEVSYFAYPNGTPVLDYSEREQQYLKENNIRLAFTTEYGRIWSTTDLMQIPRLEISQGSFYKLGIKLKMADYWERVVALFSKTEKSERIKLKKHHIGLRT